MFHDERQWRAAGLSRSSLHVRPPDPHCSPALKQIRGDPIGLQRLQRAAGNRAVQQYLQVQRCGSIPASECPCQDDAEPAAAVALAATIPAQRLAGSATAGAGADVVQRDSHGPVPAAPPPQSAPPTHLEQWLREERDAGLLDTPWRGKVAEIPQLPDRPPKPPTGTGGGPTQGLAPPGQGPPPVAPLVPTTTPSGPATTPSGPTAPGPGGGVATGVGLGLLEGLTLIAAAGAGAVVFFWSNHAPAWRDETSPLTSWGWDNEDEWKWWHRILAPPQRDYLVMLTIARKGKDVEVTDKDPLLMPQDVLEAGADQQPKGTETSRCISLSVPRRGGNSRHDTYATNVSGSTRDRFVMSPDKSFINYDGLGRPNVVWEVKTGHGWMFNPGSYDMALRTVAAWDAQKDRGLYVANKCGYVHVWSVTDSYIRDSLLIRWGGNPFVANFPE